MGAHEIRRFTPDDDEDVRAALEIHNAASEVDSPWEHPALLHAYTAMLRHGWDGEPSTAYLLSVDGKPVGRCSLSLFERDNRHLAWASLAVHPAHRRLGYGTALLEHLVEEARTAGRTTVGTDGWDSERSYAFAARFGLEKKSQAIQRRQHLAELGQGVVQGLFEKTTQDAGAYELVRLTGRTPQEMLSGVVELSAAINDAPTDDLEIEDDVMSPERHQSYETSVLAQGNRLYRLVARHRATGELVGHTVVAVEEERPAVAGQHDTAVARSHRGHRLGLLLKAGMLLWLAEAEPQIETVDTWNAESNDHMIAVNDALGYRVMGRELQFQKDI